MSAILVAACLALVPSLPAFAQRSGGGGPPSGGGMPGAGASGPRTTPGGGNMPPGSPGDSGSSGLPAPASSQSGATMSTMRGGLQLGPPGRWWDDKHFAKTLHLRPEQQKRMDGLFEENRANLVNRYQALQQEESKMEALSRGQSLDESALFAQIDRVAQARADLEKANTHLMLQVRKEMDADQIVRLEDHR
jgi:Spy/CpxP family protein refolding chaperone